MRHVVVLRILIILSLTSYCVWPTYTSSQVSVVSCDACRVLSRNCQHLLHLNNVCFFMSSIQITSVYNMRKQRENPAGITVVSDDTDVFVLLLHYYLEDGLTLLVTMQSPIKDRIVVDIGKTVEKTPKYYSRNPCCSHPFWLWHCCMLLWHWENTVLKVSFGPYIDAPLPAVIEQATLFMTACYGQKCDTMSNARLTAWAAKTGKGQVSTPRLCSLPPTTEAFVENVKRAHHQASIWRSPRRKIHQN